MSIVSFQSETISVYQLADILNKKGVWVTYCSKGDVRRSLELFNVDVKKTPGFSGKREMLRVIKN